MSEESVEVKLVTCFIEPDGQVTLRVEAIDGRARARLFNQVTRAWNESLPITLTVKELQLALLEGM